MNNANYSVNETMDATIDQAINSAINETMDKNMKDRYEGLETPTETGTWIIYPNLCKGCGLCMEVCEEGLLGWSEGIGPYGTPYVEMKNPDGCTTCNMCVEICPDSAIAAYRYD